MQAVAAMEAGAAGGACGRFSFEPELARLDFANHKEDFRSGLPMGRNYMYHDFLQNVGFRQCPAGLS